MNAAAAAVGVGARLCVAYASMLVWEQGFVWLMLPFLWGVFLAVELLGHMITPCVAF